MKVLAALIGVLVGLGLTGCAAGGQRTPVPPVMTRSPPVPPATDTPAQKLLRLPAPLTVEWTGGIDGRHITATVQPDGSWTRTDRRRGGSVRGHLDEDRLAEITRLATSAELRDEARRADAFRPGGQCADFIGVSLTMGDLVVDRPARFCGELEMPVLSRIAGLVNEATRRPDR